MSTYTDLHNKIKETINVGYRPDDRVTTQKVKFHNKENEYWGTFIGTMNVENTNIVGGTLSNVTINGGTLSNVNWPGGIDFDKYGWMIESLSADIDTINNITFLKVYDQIANEVSARLEQYAGLSIQLSAIDSKLGFQAASILERLNDNLKDLSVELTKQDYDISVVLNGMIDAFKSAQKETDEYLSSTLSTRIDNLDSKADVISTMLSNELSIEAVNRYVNDNILSDAIDDLRLDLGSETINRTQYDKLLEQKIDEISAASAAEDEQIKADLAKHIDDNSKQFAATSADYIERIEHDRHYIINKDNAGTYPLDCKDYAVNVYEFSLPDARVYHEDNSGEKFEIGTVQQLNADQLLPLNFNVYKDIEDEAIASALIENKVYSFTESAKQVPTEINTYSIVFNDSSYSSDKGLSSCKFQLKPSLPKYHKVTCGGTMIGKIYDARPEGASDDLSAGKLWIDTVDSNFETFNKFSKSLFNNNELSVLEKETERITYLGSNQFKFEKNIDKSNFIGLYDTQNPAHQQFGRIYKYFNSLSGVIYADDGHVEAINVTLVSSPYSNKNIKLAEANSFRVVLGKDLVISNDVSADMILSAEVDGVSATFDQVQVSELYKYDIKGTDENGETVTVGSVTPKMYNKTLSSSSDFKQISANISAVMWINAFKKTYELTKLEKETCWIASDQDSEGNALDLTFNGSDLYVKVTSSEKNQTVRQTYVVDRDNPKLVNPDTCHQHIFTTDVIDLSNFDEYAENPNGTYDVVIDPAEETAAYVTYELGLDASQNDIVKIKAPVRTSKDISREFIICMKVTSSADKFVKVEVDKEDGTAVTTYFGMHKDIYLMTNKWMKLQFNEVKANVFVVRDMANEENSHYLNELKQMISAEVSDRISAANDLSVEIENLSTSLSNTVELSVLDLQNQILSNDAEISDIYNRIKGGLNYKGVVYGQVLDSGNHLTSVQAISNLFAWNTDAQHFQPYADADTVLSNGYMYYVGKFDHEDAKIAFEIEGLELEVGDYVIINCKDEGCKAIKNLTSADVNIVDAIDNEDIAYLSGAIDELSANLSTDVDDLSVSLSSTVSTEYFHLTGDNSISGQNVFDGLLSADSIEVTEIKATSVLVDDLHDIIVNDGTTATTLQSTLDLSVNNLTSDICGISSYLSSEVSSNDEDIEYLSGAIDKLSADLSTDVDDLSASLSNTIVAEYFHLTGDNSISGQNVFDGLLSADSIEVTEIKATSVLVDDLHDIIVNDGTTLQNTLDLSVNNLTSDINRISSYLSSAVGGNDEDISYLSNELSTLSVDAAAISSDHHSTLSTLSSHYYENVSADIELTHIVPGKTTTISVDQLILVDEVTFKRYRLTVRNGALNVNFVDEVPEA